MKFLIKSNMFVIDLNNKFPDDLFVVFVYCHCLFVLFVITKFYPSRRWPTPGPVTTTTGDLTKIFPANPRSQKP